MHANKTMADFIAEHFITMDAVPTTSNPSMVGEMKDASHWLCTIKREDSAFPVHFSQGSAHRRWNAKKLSNYHGTYTKAEIATFSPTLGGRGLGSAPESIALRELREQCTEPTPPELASVLDCLASDASSYDNARNFADWCSEFGMDDDSIKAKSAYDKVAEQAKALRHLLGSKAYEELLYSVERL